MTNIVHDTPRAATSAKPDAASGKPYTPQRQFWRNGGTYTIPDDANSVDLRDDANVLMTAAVSILHTVIDGLLDDGGSMESNPRLVIDLLYSARYQLEMANNLVEHIDVRRVAA